MPWVNIDQYITAAIFTGTFALTYVLWNQLSKFRKSGEAGGPPPSLMRLPVVGSILFLPPVRESHKFFLEKSYEMGDVIGFQAFKVNVVVLNSHETLREVLVKQSTESANRPPIVVNQYMNPNCKGFVDSFYNANFKRYHQLSLSILKDFGFGQRIMESRIVAEVEDLIDNFKQLNGLPINPKTLIANSVLSVISSITIGDRLQDREVTKTLVNGVDGIFKLANDVFMLDFAGFLRYLPSMQRKLQMITAAQDAIFSVIDQKIALYQSTDPNMATPPESFISSFISHEGKNCDVEQLRFTLRDFLLAGYETSSTTMLWIILVIANHPDVQEKIQKELDSVVPRSRLPSLEDKGKLPYLEAVILEVMRYHTLAPLGLPHSALKEISVNGYTVPQGTMIITNIYAAHMNKKAWDEPEIFRPERFLDESRTKVINKEKVISFSLGKRSCLGELLARQEIYLFIAGLLQQFIISPPEGQDKIEVKEVILVSVQPSPFQIRLLPRV